MRSPASPGRSLPLELLGIALLLGLWQGLAMAFPARLFPTPTAVALELWQQATAGPLLADLGKTLVRALVAFVLAMALGTALGILIGRNRTLDRLFGPWIVVGLNVPAIVVAILLYIWLGLTELALVTAVVINKLPLVAATIREGVRSFDPGYDELARAFRLDASRKLRLVFLPQLLPFILAAARTGLSLIWKIVLVFEVLGSDGGVGFRISMHFQFFDVTAILAYTTAFVLAVFAIEYGLLRPLERRLVNWREVSR